ncbi:flagellar hook capping FlgD N-terminal domain-containing protein [uncultured Roseovarius sp.]|uniref:flagellar hook capping FlgD N-terminal domain-containing protein n=1 Tax=uncultured Roseovarius sp. TaxID=293344 RepID=UPI00262D5D09|nr:flagellar hook capping FlgD N-terminal domain-containing protein [uncultured Roseovarius sp.]
MDLLSATQNTQQGAVQSPGPGAAEAVDASNATALSADFETFLKMLTTQMRNQDPLNPVESSDFAVQLATFSTVEQQVLTNDLLTDLGARLGALGLGQVSGWIGMQAVTEDPVIFDGQPVTLSTTVAAQAQAAEIVATNAQGIVVNRQSIPAVSGKVEWIGQDPAGLPIEDGVYDLEVHSIVGGETVARHAVQQVALIAEAQFDGEETRLVLENGQRILASQVVGLR